MAKEILLYGPIFAQSSADFINAINEVGEGEELVVRVNTPGGEVTAGWGMVAKFKEFKGKKSVKIDGQAMSMGFMFAAYADDVEALDVSQFMLHRAAYPSWYEKEFMTEDEKENLQNMNKSLESAIRAKIDIKKFEEIFGKKMKDIFSMDDRINVYMTAKQAKEIGLVSSVSKITPQKKAEVKTELDSVILKYAEEFKKVAAFYAEEPPKSQTQKPNTVMTKESLKAEHPDLYASIVKEGIENERDRAGAWLTYIDADQKAVVDGIKSGGELKQTQMAELSLKAMQLTAKGAIERGNPAPIATDTPVETDKEKNTELKALADAVNEGLGLKTEKK